MRSLQISPAVTAYCKVLTLDKDDWQNYLTYYIVLVTGLGVDGTEGLRYKMIQPVQ